MNKHYYFRLFQAEPGAGRSPPFPVILGMWENFSDAVDDFWGKMPQAGPGLYVLVDWCFHDGFMVRAAIHRIQAVSLHSVWPGDDTATLAQNAITEQAILPALLPLFRPTTSTKENDKS